GDKESAPLPVGIGLEAGTAFVGNVGGDNFVDFTAVGAPVNAAAHIQAAARPGEILLGEGIFAAVAEAYPGSKAREVRLKDQQPIQVHALATPTLS
ncbi:MAG TPA: adenylate/guanylate cyclase domain-containing protein, partial [Alphaproteobacteria bacterium]|nr:adenylate/guanylate cyclase domain-containing protein [Alphaproteobacteria bacterium]